MFAASAAVAQEPADGGTGWRWIATPDVMQVGLAYDEYMNGSVKPGAHAVVECVLQRNGRPGSCVVVEETPGSRMGPAVIKVASYYKAADKDDAGKPTAGRKVRFAFGYAGTVVN
jgi:hypothetical protein